MKLRAVDFRRQAKSSLSGKWGVAIAAYLVASILAGAPSPSINFSFNLTSLTTNVEENADIIANGGENIGVIGNIPNNVLAVISSILALVLLIGLAVSAVMFCIGSIVEVGYSHLNLDIIDSKEVKFAKVFSFFKYWTKAVICNLLRTLYVTLWTLLFIIPGIIASYSYSMTPYILAENPDMPASDAIRRSKEIMRGNRWRLFCLQISFIGWDILCVLTLGILSLWIEPWKKAADAAFYRSLVPLTTEYIAVNDELPPQTFI